MRGTGLSRPAELAAWRLGMAHVAPFVRSLAAPAGRAAAAAAAPPWRAPARSIVSMLVLTAR